MTGSWQKSYIVFYENRLFKKFIILKFQEVLVLYEKEVLICLQDKLVFFATITQRNQISLFIDVME